MSDADVHVCEATDQLAIANVITRMAHICDMGNLDEYDQFFAEDASWGPPSATVHGLPAIIEGAKVLRAAGTTGPGSGTRHVITTLAVSITGPDSAEADSYWLIYEQGAGAPSVRAMGAYRDAFRREPAGWRIAQREVTVD
jgi:3-phenylpropionate/cinnamic acid dioxygenase small subunit